MTNCKLAASKSDRVRPRILCDRVGENYMAILGDALTGVLAFALGWFGYDFAKIAFEAVSRRRLAHRAGKRQYNAPMLASRTGSEPPEREEAGVEGAAAQPANPVPLMSLPAEIEASCGLYCSSRPCVWRGGASSSGNPA